jgi:hypothetical protein
VGVAVNAIIQHKKRMNIISGKIQIAVTEEEANIILSAVSRFRGIYDESHLEHADDIARQSRSIEVAEHVRDTLESELLDRYHSAKLAARNSQ